jgi:hypothetical protein
MICYVFCTFEININGNILHLLSPVLCAHSQGCHDIMLGILKLKACLPSHCIVNVDLPTISTDRQLIVSVSFPIFGLPLSLEFPRISCMQTVCKMQNV